jgi:predicted DNA binding protein
MGTLVDAAIPPEGFVLRETLAAVPRAEFELIRLVEHADDHVTAFCWASAPDETALRDALAADETVGSVDYLGRGGERYRVRLRWIDGIDLLAYALGPASGIVLGGWTGERGWLLRLLFPDHEAVSATYEFCERLDLDASIRRVRELDRSDTLGGVNLSCEQYEALSAALEHDYYNIPRGATLQELAESLDVSHQALSERLRRGQRALIANTLHDGSEPAEHDQ